MNIGIIGVGVVGNATAKVLEKAHKIFLYDKYKTNYKDSYNLTEMVKNVGPIFLCVSTPATEKGETDYSPMYDSLSRLDFEVNRQRKDPKDVTLIIRSTAVSGSADMFAEQYPFRFAVNPEFLTEKNAVKDMENPNRIVIGVEEGDEKTKNLILEIYKPIFPNTLILIKDRKTAEMIKYASNAALTGQIAVANEIKQICDRLGIDYNEVMEGMLYDFRIGRNIKVPGPDGYHGFGGKCFPKDLAALIALSERNKYDPKLLKSIQELNEGVREVKDWLDIPGATSENRNFQS